jgi:hypothetical protein
MDRLSRRLHQFHGRASGRFLFPVWRVDVSMAPPRAIRLLDSARAGYIAGLVDGEGTITLSRTHRNERRREDHLKAHP